jgi:hypothetical protein
MPRSRIALCALGYVAAWFAGSAAVWLKNLGISEAEQLASSGMFAFADTFSFVAVASVVAIVPTAGLLGLMDPQARWWRIYGSAGLLVACTGLVAALAHLPLADGPSSALAAAQVLAVLRVLCAPLSLLLLMPGVFVAPPATRKQLLVACAIESLAVVIFVLNLLLRR